MVDRVVNVRFVETGGAQLVRTFQTVGTASANVGRQTAAAQQGLVRVGQQASTTARQAQAAAGGLASTQQGLVRVGQAAGSATTVLAGFNRAFAGLIAFETLRRSLIGAVVDFATFETALVGVGKTTDITGAELDRFGAAVTGLTRTLPNSAQELLAVAQAAGQLGIRGEQDLLRFVEAGAKIESATELSAAEAVRSFGRIIAITDATSADILKLASVVVRLGNDLNTTERPIVTIATEIAGVGNAAGFTAVDILALAGAFDAVGLEAERSRTLVQDFGIVTGEAIREGGAQLEAFTTVLGLTAQQFQALQQNDPAQLFLRLVEGLAAADASGRDLNVVLEELGFTNRRTSSALQTLAAGVDQVRQSFQLAADESVRQTALNIEFARSMETLQAQAKLVDNGISEFSRRLVNDLRPALGTSLDALIAFTQGLNDTTFAADAFGSVIQQIALGPFVAAILNTKEGFEELSRQFAVAIEDGLTWREALSLIFKDLTAVTDNTRTFDDVLRSLGVTADAVVETTRNLGAASQELTTDVRDTTDTTVRFIETLNVVPLTKVAADLQLLADEIETFGLNTVEATEKTRLFRDELTEAHSVADGARAGFQDFFAELPNLAQSGFDAVRGGLQTTRDALVDFLATGEFNSRQFFDSLKRQAIEFFVDNLFRLIGEGANQFLGFTTNSQSAGETMFGALGQENSTFWGSFIDLAKGAGSFLLDILKGIGGGISKLFNDGVSLFNGLVSAITSGIKFLGSSGIGQAIISGVSTIGSTVVSVAKGAFNLVKGIFGFAEGGLVNSQISQLQRLAPGGIVHGPGGPRDDMVLARLSAGEYVINAQAVRLVGTDFLDAINDNRLPGFQTGGEIAQSPGFPGAVLTTAAPGVISQSPGFPGAPLTFAEAAALEREQRELDTLRHIRQAITIAGAFLGFGIAGVVATGIIRFIENAQEKGLRLAAASAAYADQVSALPGAVRSAFNDISALPGRVERDFSTIQTNALRVAGIGAEEIIVGGFERLNDQYLGVANQFGANVNSIAGRQFQGPFMSRRFGGPVSGGRLYETHGLGDREFFVPDQSGQIVSGEGGDLRELTRLTRTNNLILRDIARSERVNAENTTQMRRGGQSRALAGRAA